MIKNIALSALFLIAAATSSSAAVVLSGNFETGAPTPTLTFQEDIVFEITATASASFLVFVEWTVTDGTQNFVADVPDQSLVYSIDGLGSVVALTRLADNFNSIFNDASPNDGHLLFADIPVVTNEVFVIAAGTYTFASNGSFNPLLLNRVFTGEVFLANGGGIRLSDNVTVPEPSGFLLLSLASLSLLRRHR